MKITALLLVAGLAGTATLDGQSLLYEFHFDNPVEGTGTSSSASTSSTAAFSNYVDVGSSTRVSANLYGANQSGVSGLAGDYAFDNSGSSRMGGSGAVNGGSAGYGGMAQVANGSNLLDGATSFTLQGWYNGASTPTNYARLIEIGTLGVWFQVDSGVTKLQSSARINTTNSTAQVIASTDASLFQAGVWTFFAVTYDGISGTANLYGGTDSTAVSLLATSTFLTGVVATGSNQALTIANSTGNSNQRPFDGLLDDFRIWGDATGSAAALSLAQLEAVRLADITHSAIPEPSAFALLAGLGVLTAVAARRGPSRRV
jgi:hypothetical protein